MSEITEEEIQKRIAEAVRSAHERQARTSYGNTGYTMAIAYLNEQVQRGVVPMYVLNVMQEQHQKFMQEMVMSQPQPSQQKYDQDAD